MQTIFAYPPFDVVLNLDFWFFIVVFLFCFFFANFPLFSLLLLFKTYSSFSNIFFLFANAPFKVARYGCCFFTILDFICYAHIFLSEHFTFFTLNHHDDAIPVCWILLKISPTDKPKKMHVLKVLQCQMKDLHKHWLLCVYQMFMSTWNGFSLHTLTQSILTYNINCEQFTVVLHTFICTNVHTN